jgi:hypothetical protein
MAEELYTSTNRRGMPRAMNGSIQAIFMCLRLFELNILLSRIDVFVRELDDCHEGELHPE